MKSQRNGLANGLLVSMLLALMPLTAVADPVVGKITVLRSWGAGSVIFQTTTANTCQGGSPWWILDSASEKGYALVVTTAFALNKTVKITQGSCGGVYAQITDIWMMQD